MNFEELLRRAKEGNEEAMKQIHFMYRRYLSKTPWNTEYLMKICTRNYVQHLCGVFGRFRSEKYY